MLSRTLSRLSVPVSSLWSRIRAGHGLQPLSEVFGDDRGLPLLRYYMADFLQAHRADFHGRCLEFMDCGYTWRFGRDTVEKMDVLHVDHSNPQATLVADLTRPNDLPSDAFDLVVCTFVLHLIFEVGAAVEEIHRILKPGGALLVGVPHVSMCDPDWHELWRFTDEGLRRLLEKSFGAGNAVTRGLGNSLTAAGQIRGLTAEEFSRRELDFHDPRFAVLIAGRAVKAERGGK